ncbi:hypothetical protein [uncultured Aureimonas sp.]|uniref:hypothetical protein n=1 Tax=uncultured Aureimonas sp. TaxID=1604662 RepID=UPI0025E5D4DB|nr:hypothetical protein [uncultured Aureimonas sp.]
MIVRSLLALAAAAPLAVPATAQPFDPGPQGSVVGQSMSGAPIGGYRAPSRPLSIPNAPVFGDTVEERTYGRDYDNSYLRPRVVRPDADGTSTRLRAAEGRATIGSDTAGDFARSDGSVINNSGVTRPISPPRRARIVR